MWVELGFESAQLSFAQRQMRLQRRAVGLAVAANAGNGRVEETPHNRNSGKARPQHQH